MVKRKLAVELHDDELLVCRSRRGSIPLPISGFFFGLLQGSSEVPVCLDLDESHDGDLVVERQEEAFLGVRPLLAKKLPRHPLNDGAMGNEDVAIPPELAGHYVAHFK